MGALQEGIYHDCSGCTPRSFAIVLLRAPADAEPGDVGQSLVRLWWMYRDLKQGVVEDLPDHPVRDPDDPDELHVLLGYGRGAFELPGAPRELPGALALFGFPRHPEVAGAPVMGNAGLSYADDLDGNAGDADVAIQFTAERQVTVYRAVVETWKLLHDLAAATPEAAPPLQLAGFYSGHQRDDHRSWIDFHDGVNNLRREERERAIVIQPPFEAAWPAGGTYLAFLRVAIDLTAWRRLDRPAQERIVGRDKLTGAPLVTGYGGTAEPVQGFPAEDGTDVLDEVNLRFREQRFPDPLPSSHISRANNHRRQYPEFATSARIFRQSYEFIEPLDVPPYFRVGLNFVSFQDTPERLHTILTRDGWLGGSNFGGQPDDAPAGRWLLSARAAGMFLVPPLDPDEMFPGSSIFGLTGDRAVTEEAPTGPPG